MSRTGVWRTAAAGLAVVAALVIPAMAGGGLVTPAVIHDAFNTQSIDQNVWGWYGTNQPGNITFSQDDGALTLDVSATAGNDFNAGLGTRCKAQGDFDARLSFALPRWPSSNGVWVSLMADNTGGYNVYRVSWQFAPGQAYGAYFPQAGGTSVPASGNEGELRLKRDGSLWTGYYLSELGWVPIFSGSGPMIDISFISTVFNLSGVLPFGQQETTVQFRKFKVVADRVVCP